MRRFHLVGTCAVVSLFATSNARAQVIYEQLPGPGSSSEIISSTLNSFGQPPGFRVADDFILATSALVTGVRWWGESNSGGNNFQFTFYADGGGVPGAVLHSSGGSLSSVTVNVGSPLDPVMLYSSSLNSPFSAVAGTGYWLSVFNQAADASWLWLRANAAGNLSRQGQIPGPPWPFAPADVAFQLTSTVVPEPASLWLLGVGLTITGLRTGVKGFRVCGTGSRSERTTRP